MQKNVGTLDAFMRITCGLTGIAWSTAKMVKYPYRTFPVVTAMVSAMKVAEGITRFCPMLAMLNVSSDLSHSQTDETHRQENNE